MHENRINTGDLYDFRILPLFQSFRINSTNWGPKQTPKTPNQTPGAVTKLRAVFQAPTLGQLTDFPGV